MNVLRRIAFMLLSVASLAGCGERPTIAPPAEPSGAPVPDPAAERPSPPPPVPSRLTESQRQAVERLVGVGGAVEAAADGYPHAIDLARERLLADDDLLRAVLEFPELKRLRLTVGKASPETVAGLARLTELEELFLQDAPIDDAALAMLLRSLPDLQRLGLRRLSQVSDTGLQALPDCPRLSVVALIEMSGITGQVLQTLSQLPLLRLLDLRNCGQLRRDDFVHLAVLERLTELKLGGPVVDDEILELVARHAWISALSIDDGQISRGCLARLAAVPEATQRLRSLSFTRCFGIVDETMHVLPQLPQLESFALREIMVKGSFLQFLRDASDTPLALTSLTITDAFVTDDALEVLPLVCPRLTRLDLSGNQGLTDRVLEILKGIATLQEVQLERTATMRAWHPGSE